MSKISIKDFRQWFEEVIYPEDELIVVYSGVWTFIHMFKLPIRSLPHILIEQMLESIGPKRTLILPAYTNSFARTRSYSPEHTLPETGILPQTCLHEFSFLRTKSALDSFLAIGPKANSLAQIISPTTVWGNGSIKSLFEINHARMVTIGIPWKDSLGFLHRIEEVANVPYRYYKTFHGKWIENGVANPWKETMFVRSINAPPKFAWSKVDELLRAKNLIQKSTGKIFIESADAADIISAGLEIISDNPYALLNNANEVHNWVLHGKKAEIDALRLQEPAALEYYDAINYSHPDNLII